MGIKRLPVATIKLIIKTGNFNDAWKYGMQINGDSEDHRKMMSIY